MVTGLWCANARLFEANFLFNARSQFLSSPFWICNSWTRDNRLGGLLSFFTITTSARIIVASVLVPNLKREQECFSLVSLPIQMLGPVGCVKKSAIWYVTASNPKPDWHTYCNNYCNYIWKWWDYQVLLHKNIWHQISWPGSSDHYKQINKLTFWAQALHPLHWSRANAQGTSLVILLQC